MIETTIGIDIGGTNSVIGIVDLQGRIYKTTTVPTTKFTDAAKFVAELDLAIQSLLNANREKFKLLGIGIGAPNANYYQGTIENPPNLPWKGITPLKKLLLNYYNIPITLTNDANAAAVGEMVFGGAQKMKDFIVLTLGTGLGSGIVVNGELLYGYSGFAGELGHMNMFPDGRLCGCGQKGCLETYVSATGICRTVIELIEEGFVPGVLSKYKPEEFNSRLIAEAAEKGDPLALRAFEKTGEVLARAIVNTVVFSSPEAIFLFGGLARAGKFLLNPTQKWIEKKTPVFFKNSFQVLFSLLEEKNAAVLGSSALAWNELKKSIK
ncbi:MAG: ROK family protein [Bacteroidota bacterium]|nr:ROK family protein [Bacteroidota bacterium]